MSRVKAHTVGEIRFYTMYFEFPDGDTWCDQIPFVHDLNFDLNNRPFNKGSMETKRDLLVKGEAQWRDPNGVIITCKIDNIKKPKVWGIKGSRKRGYQ